MKKSASKKLVRIAAALACLAVLFWGGATAAVHCGAKGRVFTDEQLADVPSCRAAVVLGCSERLSNGMRNQFFLKRIKAAAELYKAGKVNVIIVSGDNHSKGYDEPTDMKNALVRQGIPEERIVCDYAGFRTLDSVVRADRVFGQKRFLVVSQGFHVRRAVFLARGNGIDAYGYAAEDVEKCFSLKTRLREQLAVMAAAVDVVIRRKPHFLGKPEVLPGE